MDKTNLVRRTQQAAWRSGGKAPVNVQQGWHDDDMRALGRDRPPLYDGQRLNGEVRSWGEVLSQPAAIIFLALLTFAAIFGVLMWRDGRLENLFSFGPKARTETNAWMAGTGASDDTIVIDEPDAVRVEDEPSRMDDALAKQDLERVSRATAAITDAPADEITGEIVEE